MTRPRLFERQLRRIAATRENPPTLEQWQTYLDHVERTYTAAEQDRYTSERSLAISSREMRELYDDLKRSSASLLATERDKLKKSVAIHEAILEAALDGVLVADEHQRVVAYSMRFVELWRLSPEQVAALDTGESPAAFVAVSDPIAFVRRIREIYAHPGESSQDEIQLLDGRTIERVSAPIRSEHAESYGRVWFFRDVTSRRRQRAQLERAKEAAERASRAKSDFLLNMSHELRTPLNAILGFANILAREASETMSEDHREYLTHMVQAGEHMLGLVNDLLDLRSLEQSQPCPVPIALAPVIEETLGLVRSLIDQRAITMTVDLAADLPRVAAERRAVVQILMNLVSNAAKFTQVGGSVAIEARAVDARVHVAVRDNGIGIAPEDQQKLFVYFEQVGDKHAHHMKGSGVGLALTRALVERQGGAITVRSDVGAGSTFDFHLPVAS